MAGELLMSISKDERERAIFRNRRIAKADQESNMITAKRISRAEGRAEGKAEADEKWQGVVNEKDAEIARLRARLGE